MTIVPLLAALMAGFVQDGAETKHRGDLEEELPAIEAAYRAAPGDVAHRRAYASILFKLGNIWEANDVIAPLATPSSSHVEDLQLGAEIALLISDFARAETLFKRLAALTENGPKAMKGLLMVYYQTDRYDQVGDLKVTGDDGNEKPLLTFMRKFEGRPYQIEWDNEEKVAHLPMINDITQPGALPLMKVKVNGHTLEFILDTGGDRLYIDEGVAEKVGIRNIAKRQSRYAYTKGKTVDEPLGVAETVGLGGVTMKNVPVVVAQWKAMGIDSDGVVTTQMLRQFLSTMDYANKRITLRERSPAGKAQLLKSFGGTGYVQMPFFLTATHLMFAKGSLNGRKNLNMLVDSGLGSSMSLVILDETTELLGLKKKSVPGTKYYTVPIESHGLGSLTRGKDAALGNVLVEKNSYWRLGFVWDALISHQYLRHLGSWTIDFDTVTYYFPTGEAAPKAEDPAPAAKETKQEEEPVKIKDIESYVGAYEVAPGVDLKVTAEDGVLLLQAPGQQKIGLEPLKDGTFEIALAGAKIEFEKDEDGAVVRLLLHQGGNTTRARKK